MSEYLLDLFKDASEVTYYTSLADKFIVPPFSILDTRQGIWKKRRNRWLSLGIKGELGRDIPSRNSLAERMSRQKEDTANLAITREAGRTTTGISIFDPVLTEICYRWFCPKGGYIFDPFAGGSVRGIVAGKIGFHYTGIDLLNKQLKENRRQAINIVSNGQINYIEGDSRNIQSLIKGKFDFILTCPPYYNLEVYSNDSRDLSNLESYENFLTAYKLIIEQSLAVLKDNRFAVFVVSNIRKEDGTYYHLVGDTVECFANAGAKLYNEMILINVYSSLPIRCQLLFRNRKIGRTHQTVLVFVKGDWKEAACVCRENSTLGEEIF